MLSNPFRYHAVGRLICVAIIFGGTSLCWPDDINFEKEIWPILEKRCHDCHNGEVQEGQLRLDAKNSFVSGGVSGKLIEPGNSDKSLLLIRLLGQGDLDQMPLDDDPLSDQQIEKLKKWIEAGAPWPDHIGAKTTRPKMHWAYQKPAKSTRSKLASEPKWSQDWSSHPIDQFVAARMHSQGLKPNPPAPRGKLFRRLHLDLIGLPPTPEELAAFLSDTSPQAYERAVDRLLALPAFGEKWSRGWLDLGRYADTNGFQADQYRSVWPYRDWVIRSINEDMPFDQFTIEQLAGDLLPNATLDQKIATGFHRLTTCNVEAGVDPEENRINQIFDRINTTGTVWFGTSFECMQCHNHKYDPFTQREYYQMFAFFNNTPIEVKNSGNDIQYEFYGPTMDLPLAAELQQKLQMIQNRIDELKMAQSDFEKRQSSAFNQWLTRKKSQKPSKWVPLKVVRFESRNGAGHQVLKDHSVLLEGKNPDKDFYTVVVESTLPVINGFKLETLTHKTLPGKGPGRHSAAGRPNFVVNELTASRIGQEQATISLSSPVADFSQKNFPVPGLIDGDPETGWAINPKFGVDHWASFLLEKPLTASDSKTMIQFTLDHQYGGGRNIGRLRISALVGSRADLDIPNKLRSWLVSDSKLTGPQKKQLKQYFLDQKPEYTRLKKELADFEKQLKSIQPTTTLVMMDQEKRMTAVLKRGNFLDQGEKVQPGTPATLHQPTTNKMRDRMDFAKWIVDRNNPLTARVVVNRWWQEIFGRGIVSTSEDFGTQGEPPSHPQLLDWLAVELMDSGWSRKHLVKQLVMSNAYQQSSAFDPHKHQRDPNNVYLARGPRYRMSAEMLRDHLLTVSRNLAHKVGGPPVFPPQPDGIWRHVGRNAPKYNTSQGTDRFRRGIYVYWRRSAPYPSFVNFDAPDRASCVVNRPTTNTPLQALTLLNDEAFFELARTFAAQLQQQPNPQRDRIANAFLACTMRQPEEIELNYLQDYLVHRLEFYRSQPEKAKKVAGNSDQTIERAAWINLVQILFNLDETITKD